MAALLRWNVNVTKFHWNCLFEAIMIGQISQVGVSNELCPGSSGVEQRTENPRVGSSNLPPGTTCSCIIGHRQTSKF